MASNKIKLRNLSKNFKGAKRALKLLERPDILLSSILVGNNFANILASAIVTILMIDYFMMFHHGLFPYQQVLNILN